MPAWGAMADPVIYLDHQASTPCAAAVLAEMAPWWSEQCANPSSRLHRSGLRAAAALEQARGRIGAALAVDLAGAPQRLVFTSGATEANNLALKGLAEAALAAGERRRHLISVASEHRAVLDPLRHLARHGFELTTLPVAPDGLLDLNRLEAALRPDTLLVSVMAANNEIGVLQPLGAIAALCRPLGIRVHCDAAQAVGHIPLSPDELGIDLLSLSGHKLGGPPGIGALLISPGLTLAPQQHGGNQEHGLRAGTPALPLVVGLGLAVQQAVATQAERSQRLGALRDQLWLHLQAIGGIQRNGAETPRLAHNLNVRVEGVEGSALHSRLRRRLAVSSGSACGGGEPSHVLQALGLSRQQAAASIRFGLGAETTAEEIDRAAALVGDAVTALRQDPRG